MTALAPVTFELFDHQTPLPEKIDLRLASAPYSESCQLAAKNDVEAILEWLKEYQDKKNTYLAYRREAVRFLLWCIYEVGQPLNALRKEDVEAYFMFLQKPPKAWRNPNAYNHQKRDWRPFKGELSQSAFMTAIRILNSLLNYLVEGEYLRKNPIKLIKKYAKLFKKNQNRKHKVRARILSLDEWEAVQQALSEMSQATPVEIDKKVRTTFLFALLYFLGLRIHEVVNHTWGDFFKKEHMWWFLARGKGDSEEDIPVNVGEFLDYIQFYRQHLGKPPLPLAGENEPLLVSSKTKRPLKITQLYTWVKEIGVDAAKRFPDNPEKQRKLKALSPHWLRHLAASHQDRLGMSLTMVQDNLRHRSPQVTRLYVHTEDEERFNQIQKMTMSLVLPKVGEVKKVAGVEYRLKIDKGPVNKAMGLVRLLAGIEQLFKGLDWVNLGEKQEVLLEKMKSASILAEPLELRYRVKSEEVIEKAQVWAEALKRQAEIWLFDCEVEVAEIKES
jgi:integrase